MKITKTNQLYQLAFMPRFFPVNCYIVEEEQSLTLVDAGLPFFKNAIVKAAAEIGKPIEKIVLTHIHSDHIGALAGLKADLPEVDIFVPAEDLKMLKGGLKKQINRVPFQQIEDGTQIGSLKAILSPGHSPGSMSFLNVNDHSLIAGDAFQTFGGLAVSGDVRWQFPFPAWATWDKKKAVETAERLANLHPSVLAVGHGDLLFHPDKQMKAVVERAQLSWM
ncbi:MBL fold metallo-hydrolase [Gracilibacillus salinarum]|uniref:MBL fold metallo-hydrolase n=1 Tax=Gracilibacillus salinarum TaxID=2932255 RepID=A0ABY4GTI5_9BACI|nr:MBL fold metallo-hydrolase [Gracilibacillus salinarum]UOQ87453.1 MBL fold metallo-hydrolase [Gracilibacillus salinarum]